MYPSLIIIIGKIKLRHLLFLLAFAFVHGNGGAQSCANYSVTRSTGITYTTISGIGASNFVWRNQSGGATNDDNRSNFTPIGFDFWYLGIRYTHFCASTNGFIDFSTSTNNGTAGSAYGPLNGNEFSDGGTGGTMLALAPVYDDLWPGSQGAVPLANSYLYKVSGTEPNRILTVEWIGMEKWKNAPYWSTPPNLNFQVQLYETSGRIEFTYGLMAQGTATFDYACGINNFWTPAAAPTASQLLTQQTANTTTFSNTAMNTLSAVPSSSSLMQFSPPAPSAAPSALSFSNVAKTSMELYWTDNATNELGYVILNSTNNSNYTFVTQVAANSTSAAISGLLSGTTYNWRVHAVTEGDLGAAATGTQATVAPGTIISVASGNWNNTATWNCTCVPTAGDNVTIANTHNVTLDVNGFCRNLTVGQGTSGQLTIGNNATGRNLVVSGDILLQNGATLTNGAANATHNMTVSGNITNNGTFNLSPTANRVCNLTFNNNGSQTLSGTGATTYLNRITMNMGSSASNVLEVTTATFGVRPSNFLTLTNGTFKLSAPSGTLNAFTGATTLTTSTGIWLNNSASTLITGNSITNPNSIRVSAGTFSIGNATNENLILNGGSVILDGGNLVVAGRLARSGLTSFFNFSINSGSLILGDAGSTTGSEAMFRLDEQGGSFSMTGGSIVLRRSGNNNFGFVNTGTTNVTVTGGTLYLADASSPASQTITLNTNNPLQILIIGNAVAATASLQTNSLTVNNLMSINSGTLMANNLPIRISGDWNNNGVFTAGTSSVTFAGSVAQNISGTTTTSFNHLVVSNSSTAGLTCQAPVSVSGSLSLNSGLLHTDLTNILSLQSTAGANAGNASSYVDGPMEKTGNTAFVFPVGKGARWARIGIGAPSSSSTFRAEYFDTGYGQYGPAATPTPALNNVSRVEYWNLDRTAGSGNALVSLYWENNNFSDINDCSSTDLRVAHWDNVAGAWENNNNAVTTSGGCSGGSAGSITTSLVVTAFSPFTFGSMSGSVNPLPIELLEFKGNWNAKQQAELYWQTASEQNSNYFDLQRSADGWSFESLAQVKASGHSALKQEYRHTDQQPLPGTSYYRLKQVDMNGSHKFSHVVSLSLETEAAILIYPNPSAQQTLHFKLSESFSDEVDLQLNDELGRMLFQTTLSKGAGSGAYTAILPVELFPGVYSVSLVSDKHVQVRKLLLLDLK